MVRTGETNLIPSDQEQSEGGDSWEILRTGRRKIQPRLRGASLNRYRLSAEREVEQQRRERSLEDLFDKTGSY